MVRGGAYLEKKGGGLRWGEGWGDGWEGIGLRR